jgi:hypothetical protein
MRTAFFVRSRRRTRRRPGVRGRASRAWWLASLLAVGAACAERDQPVGVIEGPRRSPDSLAAAAAAQDSARRGAPAAARQVGGEGARRILFGDLHVHSTYSIDAFMYSLPPFAGEGAHPPADACDFARHCSALDFFSINDHAEGLTPERWQRTIESIRECNARAGDPADPDLVAFVGWEWTQTGPTPETHFGHKNVILRGLADDELPRRPITALRHDTMQRARAIWLVRALQAIGYVGLGEYADFLWLIERITGIRDCELGVDTRELPADCRENAPTPDALFEKLAQWGLDALVIPHGLAWGVHAPPGASIENQLTAGRHDPERQRLIEIASGHGNGEEFRDFDEGQIGADGAPICPAPTRDYLPCCWQAGEIIRARCGDLPEAECEERVREARRLAVEAGTEPHRTIPDARPEDWLDCDQCRDCFKPASTLRPRETAQYAAALGNFDERGPDGRPLRFRFGFIASTDNHAARPGTGYKQVDRQGMTDVRGYQSARLERALRPWLVGRQRDPRRAQPVPEEPQGFRSLLDVERGASFLYPGGIVAVHADGRDRDSIWRALERREVYGTSGPRILLWFDLLRDDGARVPMGGEVALAGTPRFEVRAVGGFVQQPGCPEASERALSPERLARLCHGECDHPSDARHPIEAIEVVRIRPMASPGEDVAPLIEDPWRRFECGSDPRGCAVVFDDPDFAASGRDAVYYVRALQEATPAINGANVRTEFDADGNALRVSPCFGNYQTPYDEPCLAPVHERAWSSPIYVDRTPPGV